MSYFSKMHLGGFNHQHVLNNELFAQRNLLECTVTVLPSKCCLRILLMVKTLAVPILVRILNSSVALDTLDLRKRLCVEL